MNFGIKKYGSTEVEKQAQSTNKCRQIVKEIMDFGVSQKEILKIIDLLSLELENREQMKQITELIQRFEEGNLTRSTLITKV